MKTFKGQADELIEKKSIARTEIYRDICKFNIETLIQAGEYFLDKCKKVNEASNYIGFLEDEYIEINTSITKLKEAIK